MVKEKVNLLIIDGYVYLNDYKNGLGGHLYEALNKKIPVIGVAKSYYKVCAGYTEIYRGKSIKPLYISSIGIDLSYSCALIENLDGKYRIPNMLKQVDLLTRIPYYK